MVSFAAPWNLLWLAPAVGAVTLLYMLRRPRRELVVPSTQFWRVVPQEAVQVKRLQKLTPQLLFFLQLLAAAILIFAAAQPQIRRAALAEQRCAVILDNGVTMQARGESTASSRSRFADAQQRAAQIIAAQLSASAAICLLTTAPARLVLPPTRDKAALLQAVAAAAPTDAASDLPGAALLAAAALRRAANAAQRPRYKTIIVSDGCWRGASDAAEVARVLAFSLPSQASVMPLSAGQPQNLGITRFAVERDPVQPQTSLQIFAQVASSGASAAEGKIAFSDNGKPVLSRLVSARGGETAIITATIPAPARESGLTAILEPSGPDALAADNAAYAVLPAAGAARALLIGGAGGVDPGLERILGLLPGLQTDVTTAAAVAATGLPAGYALYVSDIEGGGASAAPPAAFPGSSLVFVAQNTQFVPVGHTDSGSQIVDWNRSQPVLRFVDLSGASLGSAPAWRSVGTWQPLIESQSGIVAASQDLGSGEPRSVSFSFSPRLTGFDRQADFPIIISNAVNWLIDSGDGSSAPAGQPISLAPARGGWSISRQSAGGLPAPVGAGLCDQDDSPCSEGQTSLAGIYSARSQAGTELFARNADLAVSLTPQGASLLPEYSRGEAAPASAKQQAQISLLTWAAALCLIVLLLEWSVAYSRRPASRRAV